jgi:putative ABC transport system ATP-binding protein
MPPATPDRLNPDARLVVEHLASALAGPFQLELGAGECAAVTGPSGSGKSLFLRMVADLDPSEGAVFLDGRSREALSAPDWRRRVTYVPAEAGWWAERVEEHFPASQLEAAREIAARLGLAASLFQSPVTRLSTGERQRLGLVRALALRPRVLLLDEPTGPLDPVSSARVEALLREALGGGLALLLVTHDLALAARLATRVYVMADRRLAAP